MTVRTSMAGLISRLRILLGDPVGVGQVWSDDQLQSFLDDERRRANVDFRELSPIGQPTANGTGYLVHGAPCGNWEPDAALYTSEQTLLTPSSADPDQGRWTFAVAQVTPVYIVGKTYDVYGAAADALETRCVQLAARFDFKADGQEFKRSQEGQSLERTIRMYREHSLQWPGSTLSGRGGDVQTGRLLNTDCNPAYPGLRRSPWYV